MSVSILTGDCLETLRTMPTASVQCCVTSPPYYGLRDYKMAGQIGLEENPDAYIARLVEVFREVRRVLRDDGTLWLNLGDSYHNLRTHMNGGAPTNTVHVGGARDGTECFGRANRNRRIAGVKDKDLLMIPAQVALALRADGWWLRSDIIWHKPNPMPESVTDRPTSAHEHMFLLTKSARYFYNADAVREPTEQPDRQRADRVGGTAHAERQQHSEGGLFTGAQTRSARNVWTIPSSPFSGAHFATMPPELAERCIKAGTKPGDTVLDPFGGAGTTALVADRLWRDAILCELNPEYATLARSRIHGDCPMFSGLDAAP